MKVLIIGYGSIGKRHYNILSKFEKIMDIDIVTKQNLKNSKTFNSLDEIKNLNLYDYFIIASETIKHYEQLKYICSKTDGKKILVEKPLYDKKYKEIKTNNQIFIAYNLRFHPILKKLKKLIEGKKVYYVNIISGQYLPTWRPEQDYRKSYSADLTKGGGVLRDLSHELDYARWLFGDFINISAINTKISDLDIKSDDLFTAIVTTSKKVIVNLTVDYISKVPIRRLFIHTEENTIEADMIKNTIICTDKNGNQENIKTKEMDRDYTYIKMHKSVIENSTETLCSFEDGKNIVDIIESIEFKES